MRNRTIILILSLILFSGCASMLGSVPGESMASAHSQKEILEHIKWLEKTTYRRDCPIEVLDTNIVGRELDTVIEHWTVDHCGVRTRYKVRIASLNYGQKVTVTFPRENE